MENIEVKATAKNRIKRYLTAKELLYDLDMCLLPQFANVEKIILEEEEGTSGTVTLDRVKDIDKNRFPIYIDYTKFTINGEDILNRNYTSEYLNSISIQQKYLQIAYLSLLDFEIEDLEVVRNFIIQMDSSMIELFDSLWSREDEKRKEKLNELFKTNNNILERKK